MADRQRGRVEPARVFLRRILRCLSGAGDQDPTPPDSGRCPDQQAEVGAADAAVKAPTDISAPVVDPVDGAPPQPTLTPPAPVTTAFGAGLVTLAATRSADLPPAG